MSIRYHGVRRPLPDEYPLLSSAERRAARLNAMAVQATPQDVVLAWSLFRGYYLAGSRKREVKSPKLHLEWIYCCAKWARNMIAAPRSFAKSTVVGKEWPLFLAVTRPGTDILVIVSTDKHAKRRGQWFLHQLQNNDRFQEDYGTLKGNPKSDGRMWNFHEIDLVNGSKITVMSVGSVHLGARPDAIIMDDIEPDPQKVKDWERIVEDLHSALFDVFLPMLDHGTSMTIIGTLLHRRAFLYWCMTSNDSRLRYWHRILSAIVNKGGVLQWPEKFNRVAIERLKSELGPSKFSAGYMNEPMSGDDCLLRLHAKRNMYYVRELDDAFRTEPLTSSAELIFYESIDEKAGEFSDAWREHRRVYGPFVTSLYRFMTVDWAERTSDRHDFSAVHVLGEDASDTLWSLDLWVGRASLDGVCKQIWEYAYRWRIKLIAIEAVGLYKALYEAAARQRAEMERKMGWIPRLIQVKYPAHLGKPTRMAGLEWRFDQGRVRVPDYDNAAYRMLRYQIENFTMDLVNLQYDDALDTLAMHAQVLRPRLRNATPEMVEKARKTLAQRLVDGEYIDKVTGIPYASGLSADEIPIGAIRQREAEKAERRKGRRDRITLPLEFSLDELPSILGHHDNRRG